LNAALVAGLWLTRWGRAQTQAITGKFI